MTGVGEEGDDMGDGEMQMDKRSSRVFKQGFSFFSLMFEAVSAFGNCGLSMGITSMLQANSKLLLILTMLIGRVGALTLVLALRKPQERYLYQYPEERVMIG